MKQVVCTLKIVSPYSQSKHHETEKKPKELHDDYEQRTWRERMHYIPETGQIFIPPMQFAVSLKEACKYLNIQIPGKGKSTYTKNFDAGVMVVDPLMLDEYKDTVTPERVYVPSDGRRGGTTRVMKTFGIIHQWTGKVKYYILDDIITEDVFKQVLEASGSLIGVGRFRPRNCGYYGRFEVTKIEWTE